MRSGIKSKGLRFAIRRRFSRAAGGRTSYRRGPGYSRRLVLGAVLGKKALREGGAPAPAQDESPDDERPPVTCASIAREILAALGWDL